jgi:hypothetical protein
MNRYRKCYSLLLLLLSSTLVPAQTSQSSLGPVMSMPSTAAFYYLAKPGELTIQVNVWGAVRNAGRYEVPSTIDLVQLISYAGGPTSDAQLDDVRVVRAATKEGTSERETYVVNLDDLSNTDNSKLVLHPGDTITIGRSNWSTVRDVMSIVSTVAIVTTAVSYFIIAKNR